LEARLELYKKKASTAEDESRRAALKLETAQLDLAIVRKEVTRQQDELADLRKLVRDMEAAGTGAGADADAGATALSTAAESAAYQSKRAFPLHKLGMQEKIARLKQRYQLGHGSEGE
jgi:hypothetical protein